jgi:hypothetical protein
VATRERVLAQLDRAVEAHRRAHHDTTRAARAARAAVQAAPDYAGVAEADVAELEPQGMPGVDSTGDLA